MLWCDRPVAAFPKSLIPDVRPEPDLDPPLKVPECADEEESCLSKIEEEEEGSASKEPATQSDAEQPFEEDERVDSEANGAGLDPLDDVTSERGTEALADPSGSDDGRSACADAIEVHEDADSVSGGTERTTVREMRAFLKSKGIVSTGNKKELEKRVHAVLETSTSDKEEEEGVILED